MEVFALLSYFFACFAQVGGMVNDSSPMLQNLFCVFRYGSCRMCLSERELRNSSQCITRIKCTTTEQATCKYFCHAINVSIGTCVEMVRFVTGCLNTMCPNSSIPISGFLIPCLFRRVLKLVVIVSCRGCTWSTRIPRRRAILSWRRYHSVCFVAGDT